MCVERMMEVMDMLRYLEEKDHAFVLELARQVEPLFGKMAGLPEFDAAILQCMETRSGFCHGGKDGVTGVVMVDFDHNSIAWLAVDGKARGRGIGRILLEKALSVLDGERDIRVQTFASHVPEGATARRLYEKLGFTDEMDGGKNPAGVDTVIMKRAERGGCEKSGLRPEKGVGMDSVLEHYDRLLGPVYVWMAGGEAAAMQRAEEEVAGWGFSPGSTGYALDLGAGFGGHSLALARRGFDVLAMDACPLLLDTLKQRQEGLPIDVVEGDFTRFARYMQTAPELVCCMGDTLTHLKDLDTVRVLVEAVSEALTAGGRFVVTFRDYTRPLTGPDRFIPVRSDENRILTCFLEYGDSHVEVHDLLYERSGAGWNLRASAYRKVRLCPEWLVALLEAKGFVMERRDRTPSGMHFLVALKR